MILCVKMNKSRLRFTAFSVHFNWKLQRFVCIGTFFSFTEKYLEASISYEIVAYRHFSLTQKVKLKWFGDNNSNWFHYFTKFRLEQCYPLNGVENSTAWNHYNVRLSNTLNKCDETTYLTIKKLSINCIFDPFKDFKTFECL